MRKVVEAWEKAEHKRYQDLNDDEHEFPHGPASLLPRVQKIKECQGNDAEQTAGRSGGRDGRGRIVAAHDEAKDASTDIDQEEPDRANGPLDFFADSQL